MPSDRKVYLKFPAVIELLECAAAKRQKGELLTEEEWAAGMWRTTGIPTCHLLVREQYLGRGEWFTAPKIADKTWPVVRGDRAGTYDKGHLHVGG